MADHETMHIDPDGSAKLEEEKKKMKKSSSKEKKEKKEKKPAKLMYYCLYCGSKVLRLEGKPLHELPRRRTDSAYVIEEDKQTFSLNVSKGETIDLRRSDGVERQFRLNCTGCDLVVAYRPVEAHMKSEFTYILTGSLTPIPPSEDSSKATPKV